MTSEEILSVLQDLADNQGDVLYDWDLDELSLLHELAKRLTDATRDVVADLIANEERAAA